MSAGKLTGHIRQLEDKPRAKCRKWKLVANLPAEGGKYPKRTRTFDGTYREAQAALRAFLDECEVRKGDGENPVFSQYADSWHERRARSGAYAPRTMEGERYRIEAAKKHIGGMPMREIAVDDIEHMYQSLGWAPKSVEGLHKTLSTLFNDAAREHVVDFAPTKGAKRPKVAKPRRNVPDASQVDKMIAALDLGDPPQRAVAMCASCGLRCEEAVALRWSDFSGGCVTVERAANPDGTAKEPKGGDARTVPVPESVMARMVEDNQAFCPMLPHSLSQWWRRHRAEYGMEGVRLHDLRHAYITRLAMAGVHPRVMMELAGHSSIDVCMEIYTHVDDSARRTAVEDAFG